MNHARPAHVERRTIGARPKLTPPKPKAWNHQDELRERRGKPFILTLTDGSKIEGYLAEADQFTLKVRFADENGQSVVTFSKHSIRSYQFAE
ncbi:hypothetical protein FV222_01450 [Methylobacterium sp. WL103]|uniref:hypothetical protein n=1 Tax=Methylobacterium sp. WL103 TaxID=2603891 RepID=UPI0011C8DEEE|nr:hypothetical protein [Methylobacterium sp. WL103]TXN07931.1 hypothetical protein FV222_01450 [Methylobacterium sp. WL103]